MRGSANRRLAPAVLVFAGLGLAGCVAPLATNSPPASASGPAETTAEAGTAAAPGDVLGLDETALKHWFGAPSFIRRDYPAEVWQYRAKACVLELYLYPADDHMAVTHAEAQSAESANAALGPCLASLSEAKRKPAQG
jgi:hypothetical protein